MLVQTLFQKRLENSAATKCPEAVSSFYKYQRNGQAEASIKVLMCTIMKSFGTNNDVYLALLQIQSMPTGSGLAVALLLKRPIRGLMPQLSRMPILFDDDYYYAALIKGNRIPI